MSKSVMLAMSGGTDSSVCAMLLQEQGYVVKGVTFRMFDTSDACPAFVQDAKDLAARLNMEHYVVDIRDHFRDDIIDTFMTQYQEGITPNPCVLCNNTIKWPYLVDAADKYGCDYIATGHYTRVEKFEDRHYIVEGEDVEKEQSFFLWGLPQEILSRTIFPLGGFTKDKIRQLAADRGFEKVATKKDSMGVCFLQGEDYRNFLHERYQTKDIQIPKGHFVDEDGTVLGEHQGIPFYTLGQRRGLGINLNRALYVVDMDVPNNKIVLGGKDRLSIQRMVLENCHVTAPDIMNFRELEVRIRYRKQFVLGRVLKIENDLMEIELHSPEILESPGQTAALYHQGRVVAGGWIKSNHPV